MPITFHFLAVLVLALANFMMLLSFSLASESNNKASNSSTLSVEYIGIVGGKAFFIQSGTSGNYMQARQVCRNSNLELAEIRTQDEAAFLKSALANRQPSRLWTAGRDRRTIEGMVWDGTDTVPNTDVVTGFTHYSNSTYMYCLLVASDMTRYSAYPCSPTLSLPPDPKALCQGQ